MALAVVYASGMLPRLGIPQMLYSHGLLNGLAFALLSLLAWHVDLLRSRREAVRTAADDRPAPAWRRGR
jgi:hypothetical protein